MKKILTLSLALLAVTFTDCKKIKELAEINQDFPYNEEVEIPFGSSTGTPLPVGMPVSLPPYSFATNYESFLNQYNTSSSKVIHVKLKSLSMRVTYPATQNMDFLDTVRVYVSGTGLPEKLAAYKYPVPKGVQFLDLDIIDQNIKEYFLRDSMFVRLTGFANALPAANTKMDLAVKFNLRANPLN